jgi:hypothetical protein
MTIIFIANFIIIICFFSSSLLVIAETYTHIYICFIASTIKKKSTFTERIPSGKFMIIY